MQRSLTAAALGMAIALGACATVPEDIARDEGLAKPSYVILEEDADFRLHGGGVSGFSVDDDDAIILRARGDEWYRITVWPSCDNDLAFANAIGIDAGPGGQVDRFAQVIVRGRKCPVQTVQQIENPRKATAAAAQQEG